ncbi:MAG: MotA/TolQ/ExbB proton channel family protein [Acidobacteriota bacterium]
MLESLTPHGGILEMLANATLTVKCVMGLLVTMSLASWSIIFMKLFTLSAARRDAARDSKLFQEAENLKTAMRSVSQNKQSPCYAVGLQAFEELMRMEESDLDAAEKSRVAMDNIRRTLRQAVATELGMLTKSLSFLATCANASPFIGLFGTVWGIMNSFHSIGLQQSAALAAVAPGISEALVATAIGLGVAIPATLAYNFYLGYIRHIERELIGFSGAFLNRIQREVSWAPKQGARPEAARTREDY